MLSMYLNGRIIMSYSNFTEEAEPENFIQALVLELWGKQTSSFVRQMEANLLRYCRNVETWGDVGRGTLGMVVSLSPLPHPTKRQIPPKVPTLVTP